MRKALKVENKEKKVASEANRFTDWIGHPRFKPSLSSAPCSLQMKIPGSHLVSFRMGGDHVYDGLGMRLVHIDANCDGMALSKIAMDRRSYGSRRWLLLGVGAPWITFFSN